MKLTVNQLRRIIKEEVQKTIAESAAVEFVPIMSSDLMDSADRDEDPAFARANVKKLANFAGKLLGKSGDDLQCSLDDASVIPGFAPKGQGRSLSLQNSSGDPWDLVLTLGTLDGEPVVLVDDTDALIQYFLK